MSPRIRKLAVLLGTSALLGGAVAGCGSSSTTSTSTNATNNGQAQAQPPQGGGMSSANLETLAAKLGVTTTKLQAAMDAARPTGQPSATGPTDMAAAIAKQLGLSTAKVQAALQAVMPTPRTGTPPSGGPPQGSSSSSTPS